MLSKLMEIPAVLAAQKQFEMLPARDRLALKVLAGVLGLCILYFAMWVPAQTFMKDAENDLSTKQDLLVLVNENKALLKSLARQGGQSSGQGALNSQQLVSTVTNLAKKKGLSLKRFEPSGESKIKVWMDAQSFDKMVGWLDELKRSFNVRVEQISVEGEDKAGLVSVRMTLAS